LDSSDYTYTLRFQTNIEEDKYAYLALKYKDLYHPKKIYFDEFLLIEEKNGRAIGEATIEDKNKLFPYVSKKLADRDKLLIPANIMS
jgi:hypothetical protein